MLFFTVAEWAPVLRGNPQEGKAGTGYGKLLGVRDSSCVTPVRTGGDGVLCRKLCTPSRGPTCSADIQPHLSLQLLNSRNLWLPDN